MLDWCSDDQPFPLNVKAGRMISVPYSIEMNDVSLFVGKSLSGPDFAQMVMDEFDVLYEEGARSARVMCLALHPFIINQPFRHKYLDKVLEYIAGHERVWLTTSDEVAEWYFTNGYDAAVSQSSRSAVAWKFPNSTVRRSSSMCARVSPRVLASASDPHFW